MTAIHLPTAHPVLRGSPYQGYVYAYPHKTAYRRFDDPTPLGEVWRSEPRSALFLYVHVPFCSMRCGFCNLFTTAKPDRSLVALYLDALRRQVEAVRDCLPDARFARFAVGGGTPSYLDEAELAALFDVAERTMGDDPRAVPTGVEVSPDTVTAGKVALLKSRGVERVSIGVQSFIETETANAGRPQTRAELDGALSLLTDAGFPTLNIDLIYGLPGQTVESWLYSVHSALRHRPQELYLYPLYVRPLTGLGRSRKAWDDVRMSCYRSARDLLLGEGYAQLSMRMFRRADAPDTGGPAYCCQEDGMVGLGSGARSYTRGLHYSLDYAVTPKGVKAIIADYLARDDASFAAAEHGFALDDDEQRRRYLLQSLLNADGLDLVRYTARFGGDPLADFPDLATFADLGLFRREGDRLVPTAAGLERSDAIGPWFFSDRVCRLMAGYELR
jgi:oxygen-independent coproporphyrinogen-3 oxidase